jgi:hypothetical protein
MTSTVTWLALWLGILFYELWTIANSTTGDTLSEKLRWAVRRHPLLWLVSVAAWTVFGFWFLGHIWFEVL